MRFDRDFPLADVNSLGEELLASGVLVPGFIPPPVGLLDLRAIVYAQNTQGLEFAVLPDRNLVSRMSRVARHGVAGPGDPTSRQALVLMAFCQAMNLSFDPAIAFHELASISGNAAAQEELAWFRAADRGDAKPWIALAVGRQSRVELGAPAALESYDLAKPLGRWRRNYVVALKIAELELDAAKPIERAKSLMRWMYEEFIVAGPAAVFASMYFGPRAAKRGLFKRLRSLDREEAIKGVRNAAWDMTHLSDFVLKVEASDRDSRRYIFASGDKSLTDIAALLLLGPDPSDDAPSLAQALRCWWSPEDASALADDFFGHINRLDANGRPRPNLATDIVGDLIARGEAALRATVPG